MDGYMLMKPIRTFPLERGRHIPTIALTAYAGGINYRQALKVGFQLHISKLIDSTQLINAINALVQIIWLSKL